MVGAVVREAGLACVAGKPTCCSSFVRAVAHTDAFKTETMEYQALCQTAVEAACETGAFKPPEGSAKKGGDSFLEITDEDPRMCSLNNL